MLSSTTKSRSGRGGVAHWFWVIGLGAGVALFGLFSLGTAVYLIWHRPLERRLILAPFFLGRMAWGAWKALERRLQPQHPLAGLFPQAPGAPDSPRFP